MKRIFVFLLVLVVAGISQAAVVFNDPNLKAAVEAQLGITGPNATEMLLLTSLDANSLGISDLTGLDYATNLTTLRLSNNNIGGLDLLAGLTKMQNLYLNGNPSINSLFPLSGMTDLRNLRVSGANVMNISVVANFKKLVWLHLSDNVISDITPIADINSLKYLYLSLNNISDINTLADPDVNNLKELDLSDNFISDINALSGLTNLVNLKLRYNDLGNINPLSGLTKLQYLYLSANDNITDINAVKNMKSLVELGLTDVNISDISPLADVNQIKYLWLGYNQITDINALTKDVNFITLSLSYNPLSFESWCVYLKQIINNKPSATIFCNALLNDRFTDVNDMQIFADNWLRQDCSLANGDCSGADFGESGNVDFFDFAIFAEWWMYQQ
jgi:internalin A